MGPESYPTGPGSRGIPPGPGEGIGPGPALRLRRGSGASVRGSGRVPAGGPGHRSAFGSGRACLGSPPERPRGSGGTGHPSERGQEPPRGSFSGLPYVCRGSPCAPSPGPVRMCFGARRGAAPGSRPARGSSTGGWRRGGSSGGPPARDSRGSVHGSSGSSPAGDSRGSGQKSERSRCSGTGSGCGLAEGARRRREPGRCEPPFGMLCPFTRPERNHYIMRHSGVCPQAFVSAGGVCPARAG